mmetsp:Transcript_9004/g.8395  ORF Transcript_9004/g.8395 Transcript_9004/m.8395 type:complete len:211 (-) Transcript_9004:1376-2008(-)
MFGTYLMRKQSSEKNLYAVKGLSSKSSSIRRDSSLVPGNQQYGSFPQYTSFLPYDLMHVFSQIQNKLGEISRSSSSQIKIETPMNKKDIILTNKVIKIMINCYGILGSFQILALFIVYKDHIFSISFLLVHPIISFYANLVQQIVLSHTPKFCMLIFFALSIYSHQSNQLKSMCLLMHITICLFYNMARMESQEAEQQHLYERTHLLEST